MANEVLDETDFNVGPQSISAYSRLSYTMWHALAEFIDNSTQSRKNYESIIDDVLQQEGTPLVVEITHNRTKKEIAIHDNSIGMTKADLIEALRIAHPTKDSRGRSKYGLGMKTAACWIGKKWYVITCEWGSGEEWTAEIDVDGIATEGKRIPLKMRRVSKDDHYTRILITDLHRNIQKRTEETIRSYLGSMYRFDLENDRLKILYNNEEVTAPDHYDMDTDPEGKVMRMDLPKFEINSKKVTGWIGVLRKGGRKYGGFSLFQNERQIQGFPNAWKPRSIFGGVDDEGANNLVAQRLTGVIDLDGFRVSHTKDSILFDDDEEEELEKFLAAVTRDYRDYAQRRRGPRPGQPWSKEKVKDLLATMRKEFTSDEMKDAVEGSMIPPLDTILKNNQSQASALSEDEHLETFEVTPDLRLIVSLQERSEHDPHLTITAGAEPGVLHLIINGLHPYYCSLESTDVIDECIHQYIYDAIAEYRVSKLSSVLRPETVRRLKNDLLRVHLLRIENAATALREGSVDTSVDNF